MTEEEWKITMDALRKWRKTPRFAPMTLGQLRREWEQTDLPPLGKRTYWVVGMAGWTKLWIFKTPEGKRKCHYYTPPPIITLKKALEIIAEEIGKIVSVKGIQQRELKALIRKGLVLGGIEIRKRLLEFGYVMNPLIYEEDRQRIRDCNWTVKKNIYSSPVVSPRSKNHGSPTCGPVHIYCPNKITYPPGKWPRNPYE